MQQVKPLSILLLNLYSQRYPAIGESHGLSVAAGALFAGLHDLQYRSEVVDMVIHGEEGLGRAVATIVEREVNVLGIGMPYGTYTSLKREYAALREALAERESLVVFGGPLATYLGGRILTEVDRRAYVIQGEAEDALTLLVRRWSMGMDATGIPNLLYRDPVSGQEARSPRRLVALDTQPVPYRKHIPRINEMGGQIFVESSRGCSWSACTFCLRGLTDVSGRSDEYRRRRAALVAEDLTTLNAQGVSQVTFADEDFLGSSLDEAEDFVRQLANERAWEAKFDASLTVHSVSSRKDDAATRHRRGEVLRALAEIGLRKVFLGVESCSRTQLKRYAKGHTPEEASQAVELLRGLGVHVEVGVILLDPLATLSEVEESLRFMIHNGMVRVASGLSNELRLQENSTYLRMLKNYEASHHVKLTSGEIDPDTLSYPYEFVDPQVEALAEYIRKWAEYVHPVYYPAKSLTRFGETGVLGGMTRPLRDMIEDFRTEYAAATLVAIAIARTNGRSLEAANATFGRAIRQLAHHLREALLSVAAPLQEHPTVQRALSAAQDVLDKQTFELSSTEG